MTGTIRRVVTGHDSNGRAIVVSDGPAPFVHVNPLIPGWQSTDVWRTDDAPASIPATPGRPHSGRGDSCRPRTPRCCASITFRPRPRPCAA